MEIFVNRKLQSLSDDKYREFSAKLIPNVTNILGVRIPLLRKLAKDLLRDNSFDSNAFLQINSKTYMEFTLLQAFIIGLKKSKQEEFFYDVKNFVPKINNWATCDGFCASLKLTKKYEDETFDFIQQYLISQKEYELRFGVVMLLNYFITEKYIDSTLSILTKLHSNDYYAQMAIAWALSICYTRFFDKTHRAIKSANISPEILSKTIRKVCESLQISKEQKKIVKAL